MFESERRAREPAMGPPPFSLHQARRLDRIGRLDREVQGKE